MGAVRPARARRVPEKSAAVVKQTERSYIGEPKPKVRNILDTTIPHRHPHTADDPARPPHHFLQEGPSLHPSAG
jgi:hypothetical protein